MVLGDVIREYRKLNKISMEEFGCLAGGMSKQYVSQLEKNKHPTSGKPISPSIDVYKNCASAMHITIEELFSKIDDSPLTVRQSSDAVKIKVLGRVAAGIPINAIEEIIDTEEISEELAKTGEFFGLQIHGDSMEPRICEGDVVIVRQQSDAESGDIVIALVNGDDATCKRLRKYRDGIELISNNPSYEPMFFSDKDIETKPVRIIGKVVELRGKF